MGMGMLLLLHSLRMLFKKKQRRLFVLRQKIMMDTLKTHVSVYIWVVTNSGNI